MESQYDGVGPYRYCHAVIWQCILLEINCTKLYIVLYCKTLFSRLHQGGAHCPIFDGIFHLSFSLFICTHSHLHYRDECTKCGTLAGALCFLDRSGALVLVELGVSPYIVALTT